MVAFKIDSFGGMLPAIDDRLLPDHAAVHSENAWLYTGRLQGVPVPSLVRACTPGTAAVYRIPNNYTDSDHIDDSVWMEFQDPDTNVLRATVLDDTFERYYWASASGAPRYNPRSRIAAGSAAFLLGVPQPGTPTLAHSGGTGLAQSRSYLTTWVTAYGEEGPASTPVTATGKVDDTWTLTIPASASADRGTNRNLTKTRIYRTITGTDGTTTFFLVAEIAITTLTYDDTASDAVVAANTELESTNWIGPPSDLKGMVAMPNGIFAGFKDNEIWFCEPYRPHAWPAAYALTVDYPVVGLGVTGTTLVVCTQAYPVTISGIQPASMSQAKSPSLEPCLSRGSILSTPEGVYYASPNGLIFAGAGNVLNITRTLITKDKWKTVVNAPTLRAARLGTGYFGFGTARAGMFDPGAFDTESFSQEDATGSYVGVLIDPADNSIARSSAQLMQETSGRIAVNLMSDTTPTTNVQNDPWSGELFIIQNDNLYRIDLSAASPTRRVYKWRSKVFQTQREVNFGAMRLYWDPPGAAPVTGAAPAVTETAAEFPELPAGSVYGVVRLYADKRLVHTHQLVTSGEIIRPPADYKANFWQVEVETYLDVLSIQIGTSVKALAGV